MSEIILTGCKTKKKKKRSNSSPNSIGLLVEFFLTDHWLNHMMNAENQVLILLFTQFFFYPLCSLRNFSVKFTKYVANKNHSLACSDGTLNNCRHDLTLVDR